MADQIPVLLALLALVDGAVLYGIIVARRVHERRIARRIQDSAHLYGLVRVMLADRQSA